MNMSKERKLNSGESKTQFTSVPTDEPTGSISSGDVKPDPLTRSVSGKRKEHPPLPSHPTGRFKAVSQMMVALQRFQGALNPTYTYGKRTPTPSSDGGKTIAEGTGSGPQEVTSPGSPQPSTRSRQVSPAVGKVPVYQHRGHRTQLLFAAIPDIPAGNATGRP